MLKHIEPYLLIILPVIFDHFFQWLFARSVELPPPALLYVVELMQGIGLG